MRKCVSQSLHEALSIAIDADVDLSAIDFGSVHDPARVVSALWTVKPHCPTALRSAVLHLDLRKLHLACSRGQPGNNLPPQTRTQLLRTLSLSREIQTTYRNS